MSGFKSYKIRDGVHIPSKKYKEGWDAIFSDKKKSTKGDTMHEYPKKLFNFNSDQIEVLKTALENQEKVWSKNKSNIEYYDADLSRINECLKILTKED